MLRGLVNVGNFYNVSNDTNEGYYLKRYIHGRVQQKVHLLRLVPIFTHLFVLTDT